MINYKNAIYKKLIHHLKLHLRYFQDLLHTKIEQAKRKYFQNISHTELPIKTSTLKGTGNSNTFEW